ncbi:hypothetical protein [Stratiformator vulcanicus]|uniref:Uncharacterized protein n=1 Tax=Stratiformator vulcanicus TaxID=2527980 RepID=A0A517R4U3_9PLAN|nr:hypothetical protein [Stratiformator vulcanicus]QDT38894.1 hypothetical protein Pan189_32930 [Stratiformator vulcanicus]
MPEKKPPRLYQLLVKLNLNDKPGVVGDPCLGFDLLGWVSSLIGIVTAATVTLLETLIFELHQSKNGMTGAFLLFMIGFPLITAIVDDKFIEPTRTEIRKAKATARRSRLASEN